MAWTQADADAVKAAIVALASGTRVTTVVYQGPPQREVQYAATDLPQLRSLYAEIERAVNGAPTFRNASFSKGFYPSGGTEP